NERRPQVRQFYGDRRRNHEEKEACENIFPAGDGQMSAAEEMGVEQDERHLHKLSGLDREWPEDKPVARIADHRRDEEREPYQKQRERIEPPDDPARVEDRPPVHEKEECHDPCADEQPDELEKE